MSSKGKKVAFNVVQRTAREFEGRGDRLDGKGKVRKWSQREEGKSTTVMEKTMAEIRQRWS